MNNLDGIFKSRDIILPTKVHLVKAMVFLVPSHIHQKRLDGRGDGSGVALIALVRFAVPGQYTPTTGGDGTIAQHDRATRLTASMKLKDTYSLEGKL